MTSTIGTKISVLVFRPCTGQQSWSRAGVTDFTFTLYLLNSLNSFVLNGSSRRTHSRPKQVAAAKLGTYLFSVRSGDVRYKGGRSITKTLSLLGCVQRISELCRRAGSWLILDNTYECAPFPSPIYRTTHVCIHE